MHGQLNIKFYTFNTYYIGDSNMYAKNERCITLSDTNILAVTVHALHLWSVPVHMLTHVLQNWCLNTYHILQKPR
jgi:uncharacterized membrane protein